MVSLCLPSDALLQHLPSYLGFSYLGLGVSLQGCSSKVQPLLLTLDEISTSNSQEVMKWSKRPKSLPEKGVLGPYILPISGRFPKESLGASWHWQVGINPITVEPQSKAPHLLPAGHIIHSHKHTVELVKHSRKRVR